MRHHLQGDAVAAAFAQSHHCLDAAQLGLRFDIGVASDRDRTVGDADVDGALGPRHDVVDGDGRGEIAIAGGGALQRRTWIGDHRARARLVEMLMGVDQSGNDELAAQVDHLRIGGAIERRSQRGDAAVAADAEIERFRAIGGGFQHATTGQDEGSFAHD